MREIFQNLSDRLMTVDGIKWVDLDTGQLDYYAQRPAVAFPAILVKIGYPQCRDVSGSAQLVHATIRLRVVFTPMGETYSAAAEDVKARALSIFDALEDVHRALQGWTGEGLFSQLSRQSVVAEDRRDGYAVYAVTYGTTATDEALYS